MMLKMWAIQSEVGPVRYFWIPNFQDAYVIGDDGTLWTRYKKVGWNWFLSDEWTGMSLTSNGSGYPHVVLSVNGVKYTRLIHQLVCEAVHGPCPVGLEVRHKDGNRSHNDWWNLWYGTKEDNHADRIIHGTDFRGEKSPMAILSWDKVREIRMKYASGGYTYRGLALEYGVSEGCILKIINNLTWIEM